MNGKHEPHSEFVEKLEWQISREIRRRNHAAPAPSWAARIRAVPALALAGLVLFSMCVGAGAVAAAYQAQNGERRDLLTSVYQRRIQLAREQLSLAREQLQTAERRLSLGMGSREDVLDCGVKVADAEAQVKSRELELEEIRATGHEPLHGISSPLVSGRDFVRERMQIAISVPRATLELEQTRLRETEKRYQLGTVEEIEVDTARARVAEAQAALLAFDRKIAIRQQFLNRKMDAATADLRVMEAETELRQRSLASQLAVARKELQLATRKVELGTGEKVKQAEAALRLQMLETDLARSELDLQLVRRRLEQRGVKE